VFQKVFSAAKSFFFSGLRASVVGFAFFLISVHPRKSAANLFFFSVISVPPWVDFDFPITRCPDLPILISVISVHQR
jgi:hypothetical protein